MIKGKLNKAIKSTKAFHEYQETKTKMSKIIDIEELEKCKKDKYYFFKKYVLINGEEPMVTREQFQDMVMTWGNPHKTLKAQRPYSSLDESVNDCGDANEY